MTVEENNKLIAEFMGLSTKKVWADCIAFAPSGREIGGYVEPSFYYHSSWDLLMPVCQKIFKTEVTAFNVFQLYVSDALRTAEIKEVYYSVISFIEYYNNQPS
jgi:hypothetical protein